MKTRNITELARVIRSKNAGPFELTFDIIFTDADTYERVKRSGVIRPELFAELYRIPVEKVLNFCFFDPAHAVKATIARSISSGTAGDNDVFGAQQHAPLLQVEIPWD
ncbi:MAG: DUF4387 domain-containing protein [Candidatus Abyssobacteria bacterium SURF_5]|uniref:DUF4387 domain-containing protein n=1 Tax=Abyssobacteria bacterium (strain SURF_5) TaxID=2093360 RepID=A0A3A4NDI9_ABYX5|nr:MAG: DUF4387 domain-containing protein [Candidatus Abyssubacteria bacterium SURF_5]